MKKSLLMVLLLVASGCGNSGTALLLDVSGISTDATDAAATDDVAEVQDVAGPSDTAGTEVWDFTAPDADPADTTPACAPGEGCFLDPCQDNADCQSGWCVSHMGQSVCTTACQEECPAGWACKQVAGTDPDLVYVCVSQLANLCKPCAGGADCMSPTGASDACIVLTGEGSFCGGGCTDKECPVGFSCENVETVDGVPLQQCVPDNGLCPCTDTSAALGLWTPCAFENESGLCTGKRVCTAEGLTDCDAPVPAAETCNGLDDDCDGDVDEPDLVEGTFVHLCHDGNPCTDDACLGEAGCDNAGLDDVECTDGNPCTVADHCVAGACVGELVDCDDNNICTDDVCGEAGGCQHLPNNVDCDDGDPCTVADECNEGTCAGQDVACDCMVDVDCAPLEDGDLCNGTLLCDTSSIPHLCKLDPDSVVTCPEPEGLDAICKQASCDPLTGACTTVPDHEAALCEDGNACTVGDTCAFGTCAPGKPANCSDGNICTDDACDGELGCIHTFNEADCDDGNDCTIGDYCAAGQCISGAALACDDNNPCTADACDEAVGCVHTATDGVCNDGNACTVGDLCVAGACQAGSALQCNDDNPCTDDNCDPKIGCVHGLNQAPCNDGDVCTVDDVCKLGECSSGSLLNCNDNNPCTDDSCQPDAGCQFVPNAQGCNDGNACTTQDVCTNGQCQGKGLLKCSDDNPCTDDVCDPDLGCLHTHNEAPCSDNSVCTAGDVCANGECVPGPSLSCDDGSPCTDDECDPATGCLHVPNQLACDDGDACTDGDSCANGSCIPGAQVNCDDLVACTLDGCAPDSGCTHLPVDGECNDGEVCTADTCDPVEGCLNAVVPDCCGNNIVEAGEQCDDGNHNAGDGCDADCKEEVKDCANGGQVVSIAPSGTIMICKDPAHATCEQDLEKFCPAGWHLCSHLEFYNRNDGWNHTATSAHRALGVIQCRQGGGAGHYTVPDAGHSSWDMGQDEQHNCYFGSSRPECPSGYGCNETQGEALCCAPAPSCGNGQVDSPEESCDDGNNSNSDACLNNCTLRTPGGGGTNC